MSFPIDTTIPGTNNFPGNDQPGMQTNFVNINGYVQVDHTDPDLNPGAGRHKQVTFHSNNIPAVFPISPPVLFTDTVAGLPQLKFFSGDAAHSANQYVVGSSGSTFLLGGIIIKWGTINFVANSQLVTFSGGGFPNNLFAITLTAFTTTPAVNGALGYVPIGAGQTQFTAYQLTGNPLTVSYIAIGN